MEAVALAQWRDDMYTGTGTGGRRRETPESRVSEVTRLSSPVRVERGSEEHGEESRHPHP